MTPAADILSCVGVSKRYGTRWALRQVTCSLKRGEAVMLSGDNGAGKTTLLRVLAGALRASGGTLQIDNATLITDRELYLRSVGLVSHASGHYDDLTALENLQFHCRLLGVPSAAAEQTLLQCGLAAARLRPVREFSAGMRKRLSIARLLLKKPAVVLLDEPFGELDPAGMVWMEEWIGEQVRGGSAVILATHWLEQGARLTSRHWRMTGGDLDVSAAAVGPN